MQQPRLETHDDAPPIPGLRGSEGLAEAEAFMLRLAVGGRLARLGHIAQEHLATGGHRMRARLALAASEALGVEREEAAPWAAACELLHNATLLHDDIQDGDTLRRGAPTAWVRHGIPQAINAGDLLLVLPTRAIDELRVAPDVKWRLALAVVQASERAARGQSADMDLAHLSHPTWDDWTWAADGKTGTLLGLPVHGAAILAGLAETTAVRLAAPFAALGRVYQMLDDVADLEEGSDLAAGRLSAVTAAHLSLHPEDTRVVTDLLRAPERTPAAVQAMVERLRASGAVTFVQNQVERTAFAALTDPTLRAVPALTAVAEDLLARIRRNA